jgi:hypothetical protein
MYGNRSARLSLAPPKLAATIIYAMYLKHVLCQVQSDYFKLLHDAPPAQWLMESPLWHFDALQNRGVHFINLQTVEDIRVPFANAKRGDMPDSNEAFIDHRKRRVAAIAR